MIGFDSGYDKSKLSVFANWKGSEPFESGHKKEADFGELIKNIYTDVRPATLEEQLTHIDWICSIGTIDVKAIKRISRHGDKEPDRIWVEFRHTKGGYGWLYGKQDFIAFEQNKYYVMVRRSDLAKLAEKLCDQNDYVTKAKDALYKVYNRKNTRDLISMIKITDLLSLQHKIIKK